MDTPEQEASSTAAFAQDDHLLQLELKIAQRADVLLQASGSVRGRDLEHWLQAEREVLARCRQNNASGFAAAGG